MITQSNREEFEQTGVDDVRKRVLRAVYTGEKLQEARQWLKQNDPAWISAKAARGANARATIALIISVLSLLVAIAAIIWR
jgi:hypothetical protein